MSTSEMNPQDSLNESYDVFISFQHDNRSLVKPLVEELERCNISCFVDWKDGDHGQKRSSIVSTSISASKVFLLIWTEDVKGSEDIISEISLAKRRKKIIIPYKIGNFDADKHDSMICNMVTHDWIEAPEQTSESITNVVKRVQKALTEDSTSSLPTPRSKPRIEAFTDSSNINDMPQLPAELVSIQSECRAVLVEIDKIKSFKHESLDQENNAVEQAQKEFEDCKQRKDSYWQNMPETMQNTLGAILEKNPNCSEESLPFDLDNMSNEQYLDFMKQFLSGKNCEIARVKLDNAKRQREKKCSELIELLNQKIQDVKKQEKSVIQSFLDNALTVILSKLPGYNDSKVPYPAEEMINQIPLLNIYELNLKALEINRRAQKLWESRPCVMSGAKEEYDIGRQYFLGLGKQIDEIEAVKHFQIAAEKGYANAQLELSRCYFYGKGVLQDKEKAEKWFNKSFEEVLRQAHQGDVRSQNIVGDCYCDGCFIEKDESEAVKWYRMAVEQGDSEAQASLGITLLNREGVDEDKIEAFKLLRMSSEQGDLLGQYGLGLCYSLGCGVPEDKSEAVKWYQKAAEQGEPNAQCILGYCYFCGVGVPEDKSEAVKWYQKAAERGNVDAQCSLGNCYFSGEGVPENITEAVKWYQKAADQGDVDAQYSLGNCYFSGEGVPENKTEAVKWYQKAADQGNVDAQCCLGNCYFNGEGVPENKSEAVKWYQKSADQGNPLAQCSLGNCYFDGNGVPENKTEAVKWYQKAADQGFSPAQCFLGTCYLKGDVVPEDQLEAVKWYRKAAVQEYSPAQCFLGNCYAFGVGVQIDEFEAKKWYEKAAEQGDKVADRMLLYYEQDGVFPMPDDVIQEVMQEEEEVGDDNASDNQSLADKCQNFVKQGQEIAQSWYDKFCQWVNRSNE